MLRVLAESFVVSPPSGVTIKTRLRPTPAEEQALREVGTFLGSLYRADLVRRLREGKLDAHGRAQSRKVRKKALTAQSSSRWAGSITRATQDQYDLAVRALAAERAMLVAATGKLSAWVAAPAGGRAGKIAGYRSQGEWHGKTRRLAQLTSRLGVVDTTPRRDVSWARRRVLPCRSPWLRYPALLPARPPAGAATRADSLPVAATSMARSAASARTARSYWSWVA